ncbi:MAG: oligosaccharide flippase family protein, partial [Thiotrichaceae bacterium]|nr:oligosaccharide flippase family protein [Thiotrichaceae bacterium]
NLHSTRKIVSFIYVSSSSLFKDKKLMVVFLSALMVFYVEQLNSYISILFSSGLGSSAVSFLSYANKLNLLLVSVFIVFLNVYAFPKLSVKRFERQEEMSSFLVTIIKSIAIFCFPMVYILYSCAEPVIAMVFGRGSFAQSDVIVVASVFQMLILSLPLLLIRDLLNRVIFAYESSSLSLIALLISVALHVIFVKYYMISYGLQGIAVGVAVSAFINSFILAVFLKLFFNNRLVVDSLKTIVICVASLVVSYLLSFLFASYVVLEWWGESLLMLVGYFYCLYLIREEQSYNIIKWLVFR